MTDYDTWKAQEPERDAPASLDRGTAPIRPRTQVRACPCFDKHTGADGRCTFCGGVALGTVTEPDISF
jgi:hypothetical protein